MKAPARLMGAALVLRVARPATLAEELLKP